MFCDTLHKWWIITVAFHFQYVYSETLHSHLKNAKYEEKRKNMNRKFPNAFFDEPSLPFNEFVQSVQYVCFSVIDARMGHTSRWINFWQAHRYRQIRQSIQRLLARRCSHQSLEIFEGRKNFRTFQNGSGYFSQNSTRKYNTFHGRMHESWSSGYCDEFK